MLRPAPEDSQEATPESLRASPARAPETTRCAIDSPQSNPPRRAHIAGIPQASYGAIFLQAQHSLGSFQFSKIHSRFVIESHASTLRMLIKDPPQLLQHRFMLRMSRPRRIRRRQQPSLEPGIIEFLPHRVHSLLKWRRIEEFI